MCKPNNCFIFASGYDKITAQSYEIIIKIGNKPISIFNNYG